VYVVFDNILVDSDAFTVPLDASNPVLRRFGPTILGLGSIPLIIHPVDNFVHWALDNTIRPWMAQQKK